VGFVDKGKGGAAVSSALFCVGWGKGGLGWCPTRGAVELAGELHVGCGASLVWGADSRYLQPIRQTKLGVDIWAERPSVCLGRMHTTGLVATGRADEGGRARCAEVTYQILGHQSILLAARHKDAVVPVLLHHHLEGEGADKREGGVVRFHAPSHCYRED
jgi:hypothetical protein